jgi:hypothetical protein
MKKIYILIICLFTFSLNSCSVSKELKLERKTWNYKNWDKSFKERAFCLCVLKGYENKTIENILFKNDRSFYETLSVAVFDKTLEPIIKIEVEKIKQDSINSLGSYPDDLKVLYQKRRVFKHCLDFYNGKELSQIAKKEKKKWKKIPNIMDEIHKSIPSY